MTTYTVREPGNAAWWTGSTWPEAKQALREALDRGLTRARLFAGDRWPADMTECATAQEARTRAEDAAILAEAKAFYAFGLGTHKDKLGIAWEALPDDCQIVDGHPVPYSATIYRNGRSIGYLGAVED